MSAPAFGYSITARKAGSAPPGVFISGLAFETGRFRPIVPLRQGDFVPVSRTGGKADAVVAKFIVAGISEKFMLVVVDVGATARSVNPRRRLRGMAGFEIFPAPTMAVTTPASSSDTLGAPP